MRVLADYHHGDLYESFAILFEDRFGWELYRPTGMDWAQSGIWSYSEDPVVRLQYLGARPDHRLVAGATGTTGAASNGVPGHYEAADAAHPGRVHKLVTLEQFRALRWDFILASVTQHERSWRDLAHAVGARSIYQVGNVGQMVDWDISEYVLVAARTRVARGRGMVYHPEFNLADYRYDAAGDPHIVTNFMNCLSHAGQAYSDWLALKALLPEFTFREYGIIGRDGCIKTSPRIASLMNESGWAFHNKPQGDGYGFVVHQWAAVGRPLVGRKSYYSDKLAEPLWKTGLDLGAGPEAVARVMRAEVEHGRLGARCEEAATIFRETVDFDRDATAIYDYLVRTGRSQRQRRSWWGRVP